MTAKQAIEWETFAALEPFGDDKIVQALAYIASIFANGTLKKKGNVPWKMEDFLIKYFRPPEKKTKAQPLDQMKKMIYAIGSAFGAKGTKGKVKLPEDKHRIKYEAEKYIPRRTTPPVNTVRGKKNG